MTRFERDKRAAIEAVVELLERIDKATVNMENAREEKDLVTFVYWFVLIHEYYYMLCEKPVPQRIAGSIYAEIESCSPIDYLKNKQKQRYERLPNFWFYGRGYSLEDIIGCAIYNRYDEELFTFSPDIRKMMCEGNLSRQNLMLHFLRKGENHEYVDFCDVCGKNLNDQPYPYAYRCTKCRRLFNLCTKCSNESAPKYWGNVGIMPKYDRYDNIVLDRLYNIECKTSQKEIDKLFTDKDVVQLPNGGKVKTCKIVHLVKDALELLKERTSYCRRYISKWLILYTCDNSITRTFAFDTNSNIYINVGFIHAVLKMDVELVCAMLFQIYHHDLYEHFKRQNEMLNDEGITNLTVGMHHLCNMATEVEANRDLMRCLIVPKETWIDGIGGLFLQMKSDDYSTGQVNDIGWRDLYRDLYEDPKRMELLRKQLDVEFTLSPAKIHRSSTFRSGYDYAWHRISTLCVNYGIEKTHEKLRPIVKYIRKDNLQSLQDMFN